MILALAVRNYPLIFLLRGFRSSFQVATRLSEPAFTAQAYCKARAMLPMDVLRCKMVEGVQKEIIAILNIVILHSS